MDYLAIISMSGDWLTLVIACYFLFVLICGEKADKGHSFIIFLASSFALYMVVNSHVDYSSPIDDGTFVRGVNIAMLLDGATALILTMMMVFDKKAWKQASLLACASFVHFCILYDKTVELTPLTGFMYNYYEELIITIGFSQMAISFDGFILALGNLSSFIRGVWTAASRSCQNSYTSKSGEGQA